MNNRLNGLRVKLTIVNTAVLIGLLVFCTIFLYVSLSMNNDSDINNSLEIYCAQLAGNLDYLESGNKDSAELEETKKSFDAFVEGLSKNNVTYTVWNENLGVIDQSKSGIIDNGQLLNLVKRYVNGRQSGYWVTNYQKDNQKARICTYTLVNKQGEMKTIQVIKNMAGEANVMSNAVNTLILMVLVGGVVSILCGYFLSGHSLAPVKEGVERQQEFLANASHELRTPIAVIMTNLEVVQADGNATVDSQKEWLGNAYEESKRMQRIVEDLMFLARADAGEVHGTEEPVDMVFLSQEVIERMLPVAMNRKIMLDWEMPDHPLMVMGDPSQLTQLLVIFVDNAVKYSDKGTTVTIVGREEESKIIIEVRDQGIGIAPEDQEKIFGRFYRVDKVRSREEGGTGLGLSIATWIVKKHRGTIQVKSEEKAGTTMIVSFPQCAKDKEDDGHERITV